MKCELRNAEVLLSGTQLENVKLPNAIVKVNITREFFTSILNLMQPKEQI